MAALAKGKGKPPKKKKEKDVSPFDPDIIMPRFLFNYEKACRISNTAPGPTLKTTLRESYEKQVYLYRFILDRQPMNHPDDLPVCIEPLIHTLRSERYVHVKDLHIWEIPLSHQDMASLALALEKALFKLRTIELMDCLVEPYPLERLLQSFAVQVLLSTLILDYNEFGDKGCQALCTGLKENITITTVSLRYCNLGIPSGKMLGRLICTTAICNLYVDGNELQCEGAVEIVKVSAIHAEVEMYEKMEEEKRIAEERAAIAAEAAAARKRGFRPPSSAKDTKSTVPDKEVGKKGKKGKKKKKEPPPPPPVGPWISKLHLADNSIDMLGTEGPLGPLIALRLFRKLITFSANFVELDLEDNLIGDVAGREILGALEERKEKNLPGLKVRTTHRMQNCTFDELIKIGAGSKKKKKGKKKKKKKK